MTLWSNARRVVRIASVLVRHALSYAVGRRVSRRSWAARRFPSVALSGPERLRQVFEDLGGTFIKFGQMLALQPDILPLEYCNALFDLLDRVAPFPFEQVERTFLEDLGRRPSEFFDAFDPRPIATASIGQVHVAFRGGRKLAVKVQRPKVDTEFAGDVRLMAGMIGLIRRLRLRPLYWVIEPMGEFAAWTREEMDYRHEARYMEQLRRNASGNDCERVPEVLWELTTRRILVAEFLDGVTVLGYLRTREAGDPLTARRLEAFGFDANRVAASIIDNFLGDAFRYGLFHADLHPANLMILPGNVVGYVDFGITGVLSRYSRQKLVELTLAYTRADLDGMCAAFFKVSVMSADSDPAGFRQGLQQFAEEWYEVREKKRRLRKNFTLVMVDMLKLSRRTGIWPERDVIKYIRSSIAIDGLITRFAPGFNVGRYLETVCDRYLRAHARQVLFSYGSLVDWSTAMAHLARDGPHRAAGFFRRMAGEGWPGRAGTREANARDRDAPSGQRTAYLSAVVFGLSMLAALTGEPPALGLNLFTAEAGLAAVAVAQMLRTILR